MILEHKNNKCPGIAGFLGEYSKIFVNGLTPVLCTTYNYESDLPESCSDAIIYVIHKASIDPIQGTSYHPVSLYSV